MRTLRGGFRRSRLSANPSVTRQAATNWLFCGPRCHCCTRIGKGSSKRLRSDMRAISQASGSSFGRRKASLAGLKALTYVKQLHPITKRIFVASELLAALHEVESEPVEINLEPYIANVGNLNYDIFEQIAGFLCIDATRYAVKKQLIDESLLSQRNDIAHGDYLLIDPDGFESLSDEIIVLMRQFKTDIENGAALKSYLRMAAPAL